MTAWTILNVELALDTDERERLYEEYGRHPADTIRKLAHDASPGDSITSYRYHGNAVICIWGYRSWARDERFVSQLLPEAWERCVIVQANDTADVGVARLYEKTADELEVVDEYAEDETEGEHYVGDLAAATMFAVHGVACLGNITDPFDVSEQRGEWVERGDR